MSATYKRSHIGSDVLPYVEKDGGREARKYHMVLEMVGKMK